MEIPRSEWIKLGVFLHPKTHIKVRKLADAEGISMTKYVEALIAEHAGKPKQKVQ